MRNLVALTRRWQARRERREYFIGLLCAVTANYSMRAPKEALKPEDFVPSRRKARDAGRAGTQMNERRRQGVAKAWEALMSHGFAGCTRVETGDEG